MFCSKVNVKHRKVQHQQQQKHQQQKQKQQRLKQQHKQEIYKIIYLKDGRGDIYTLRVLLPFLLPNA